MTDKNDKELDKIIRDTMVYGVGITRVDPKDFYKPESAWRSLFRQILRWLRATYGRLKI